MAIHQYPCPTCWAPQRIKAAPGEVVTLEDCAACAQAKAHALYNGDSVEAEVNEALDRYAKKLKR